MKKVYGLIVLLLGLFLGAQIALQRSRTVAAPAISEGVFAALGGLRSIVAEVIWFRADRLQEEGLYVELSELADMLTKMEPHTPEVWSYAAWNLAYNISVMMDSSEDRWRWVLAGIRLLRDEGLKLNPGSPELTRELAWLFELKLAANIDSSAADYRAYWKTLVMDIQSREAWEELGMEKKKMLAIEKLVGFTDWTHPALSAIYWANEGLSQAHGRDRRLLLEIIRQSQVLIRRF